MSYILISFFFFLTQALAHTPPPIDVTNSSGQKSHSGYGYYGNDDYEGFVKLRKSCTEQDRNEGYEVFKSSCLDNGNQFQTIEKDQYKELAQKMVNGSFIDKILSNAIDEIKLVDPAYTPTEGCFETTVDPKKATLQNVRKEAMSLNNALSATLLSVIHSNTNEKGSDYRERLEINYPYLFKPTDKFQELALVIKKEIGPAYDVDRYKTTAHYETMSALKAIMDLDATVSAKLNAKLEEIKNEYGVYLKENINKLCRNKNELYNSRRDSAKTIIFLHENFRRDFQQNLIDLEPADRAMANEYLCKQDFYYKPGNFDSDCDGVKDNLDLAPNDPFIPNAQFSLNNQSILLNPPFANPLKYNAKLEGNVIKLIKPIVIQLDADASSADKASLLAKARTCTNSLSENLKANFDKFKTTPGGKIYSGREFQVDFQVATSESDPEFKIHKCWCSTCSLKYIPPGKTLVPVPKSICRADFTPEMVAAMSNTIINPTSESREWFMQEDSENLTDSALSEPDCKTIKHELMHTIGLPDEYHNESYYPFNQIGPESSIMSGGTDIFPRHLVNLLSPKACERGSENYGY